jgi:hypothetical protein
MTPARARHIIATMGPFGAIRYAFPLRPSGDNRIHADGITWEENQAVHRLWGTLAGTSCYYDALQAVARGATIPAEIPADADGIALHLPEADPLTIPEASYQPGYPGPCPEGMDWSRWLAMNNVD